jgi:hypothetical protein
MNVRFRHYRGRAAISEMQRLTAREANRARP